MCRYSVFKGGIKDVIAIKKCNEQWNKNTQQQSTLNINMCYLIKLNQELLCK